jgi:hypothetical protein
MGSNLDCSDTGAKVLPEVEYADFDTVSRILTAGGV